MIRIPWHFIDAIHELTLECRGTDWFAPRDPHRYEHNLWAIYLPSRLKDGEYHLPPALVSALRGALIPHNIPLHQHQKLRGRLTHPDARPFQMDPAIAAQTAYERGYWIEVLEALTTPHAPRPIHAKLRALEHRNRRLLEKSVEEQEAPTEQKTDAA